MFVRVGFAGVSPRLLGWKESWRVSTCTGEGDTFQMEIAFFDVNLLHLLALHGLDSKESTGQRQAGGHILQLGQDLSPRIVGV